MGTGRGQVGGGLRGLCQACGALRLRSSLSGRGQWPGLPLLGRCLHLPPSESNPGMCPQLRDWPGAGTLRWSKRCQNCSGHPEPASRSLNVNIGPEPSPAAVSWLLSDVFSVMRDGNGGNTVHTGPGKEEEVAGPGGSSCHPGPGPRV